MRCAATLWSGLIDADILKQYWFENHCESQRTAAIKLSQNIDVDSYIANLGR